MKKILLIVIISVFNLKTNSQEKRPFFTGALNFTFALNDNYVLFDPHDEEEILEFSALMTRFGIGYQFDKKWAGILYIGYDYHTKFNLKAIPMFGTLRYNISEDDYDSFFTQISFGNL